MRHDEPKTPATADTLHDQGGPRDVARELAPAGYTIGAMLGSGGMGEVLLARDERIGRDVAIKRMRSPRIFVIAASSI